MTRIIVTLVNGNSSWWKRRKYRRETAHRLRRLRDDGWRLVGLTRLEASGVDTRRRTAYHLERADARHAESRSGAAAIREEQ
jgi:hypothetical protein